MNMNMNTTLQNILQSAVLKVVGTEEIQTDG